CWMVSRDDLPAINCILQQAPAPGLDAPLACERPHGDVAEGDDDIWLDKVDFLLQQLVAFEDRRHDKLVTEGEVGLRNGLLRLREPEFNVVARRLEARDVGDEAFGAKDASIVKHRVEELAARPDERFLAQDLLLTWGFPHDHYLGVAWTG